MLLFGLVGARVAPLLAARLPAIGGVLAALVSAALFVWFWQAIRPVGVAPIVDVLPWVPALGIDLDLRLDGFLLLFALLITGIGTGVTLYAAAYFDRKPAFVRGQFLLYIQLFMMAMLATVLADNLLVIFVFWEITSLLSFLLVGSDGTNPIARRAALQSLLVTVAGGLALLAGIFLIGVVAGTISLSALVADSSVLETLFVVIVMAVLLRLPVTGKSTRTRVEKLADAGLATGFAAVVFTAAFWITAKPFDATLTRYFAETSNTEAFGRNVVNVILVDFRALDTFGEITVVAFAALAAWALLRPVRRPAANPPFFGDR